MKRCLNCMSEYQEAYDRCPSCGYISGTGDCLRSCIPEGSILEHRYIVGRVRYRDKETFSYVGWDALFERRVVIREFFPGSMMERNKALDVYTDYSKQEEYDTRLEKFVTDGKELIRLYREPDIITVYSCFRENGTAYLITEYNEWETVSDWTGLDGRLETKDALNIMHNIIRAVKKVHALNLIHGNIHAGSIYLFEDKSIVLKDFVTSERCDIVNEEDIWTDIRGIAQLFCCMIGGSADANIKVLEQSLSGEKLVENRYFMDAMRMALSENPRIQMNTVEAFEQYAFRGRGNLKNNGKKKPSNPKSRRVVLYSVSLLLVLCFVSVAMSMNPKKKSLTKQEEIASESLQEQEKISTEEAGAAEATPVNAVPASEEPRPTEAAVETAEAETKAEEIKTEETKPKENKSKETKPKPTEPKTKKSKKETQKETQQQKTVSPETVQESTNTAENPGKVPSIAELHSQTEGVPDTEALTESSKENAGQKNDNGPQSAGPGVIVGVSGETESSIGHE